MPAGCEVDFDGRRWTQQWKAGQIRSASHAEAVELATKFMELHRVHWPDFEGEAEVRALEEMNDAPHP
jgi:diketogulonate reductase-like aldo/keto reductase